MYITFTGGKVDAKQAAGLDRFLAEFLPRYRKQPGVLAVYHFYRPDKGDDQTITIWESESAALAYRKSDLIKEPLAFEKESGLVTTREGYPLSFVSSQRI